jgi:hypothetical protein
MYNVGGNQHDWLELPGKRFRSGGFGQENLAIACKVFILGLGAGIVAFIIVALMMR